MDIEGFAFDIGGVLLPPSNDLLYVAWETKLGLPPDSLGRVIFGSERARLASIGETSAEEVWREVENTLSIPADDLKLLASQIWPTEWNNQLMDLIYNIKKLGKKTAIISNNWSGEHDFLRCYLGNDTFEKNVNKNNFDVIVYSSEEGIRKPDLAIYQLTLERLHLSAEQVVYIDDKSWNVAAAEKVGLTGILYENCSEALRKLKAYLPNCDA